MPNSAIGLLSALGLAEETAYGTPVAPARWHEFLTEGLERHNNILQSEGLRAQTLGLRRGSRRVISTHDASGPVTMEVPTTGFGLLLKHAIGGTPTIAQQAGTPAWLQTHTLGSTAGKFLTLQKQLRDSTNTLVQQFTVTGAKVKSVEFSIGVGQMLQAAFDFDGRDIDLTTAAGTPSYPNNRPFYFAQGALTVGGSAIAKVTDAKVKLDRPMKTDGYYIGAGGLKSEPYENAYPSVTGSLTAEFDSNIKTAILDRFAADSAVALVLQFTGAVISGIYNESFSISLPEIHFTGETPKIGGPGIAMVNAPFDAAFDGTNPGIIVFYTSTDTAI